MSKLPALALCLCYLASTGCLRQHCMVRGLVLAVDPPARTITVSHKSVPGYMPAMTMPFRIDPREPLPALQPGMRVRFTLYPRASGSLTRHWRTEQNAPDPLLPVTPPDAAAIGAALPSFQLTDQHGAAIALASLRSQVVVLNFLYTRCPLPEVCPRLAANFSRLQRRFAAEMQHRLTLLSLTIDPVYDTPAVLNAYAARWNAGPGWHLLTGAPDAIAAVARHCGLTYWPEDGAITHSTRTVILSPDGRIAAAVDGTQYDLQQLGDLIAAQLREAS